MGLLIDGNIKMTIFGESHGTAIGGVITGFPVGVEYDEEFVAHEMARRAPSNSSYSTKRKEADKVIVLSGITDNMTSGSPIAFMIENTDQHSNDYANIALAPRPSHADYTANVRFGGFNDARGGGHFSGRLTAPMVFAGALCKLFLKKYDVRIGAHIRHIGDFVDDSYIDYMTHDVLDKTCGHLPTIKGDEGYIARLLEDTAKGGDSIGAVVECGAYNVEAGLGGYMADSVESRLASIMYAIPAVKGVEFGGGADYALGRGSEKNDEYAIRDGNIVTTTNNNGGILGGITSGMPIVMSVAIKPTPSIYKEQNSVDLATGEETKLTIKGRHDPCVAIRAIPVVESGMAIALADLYMEAYGYNGTK